MYHSSPHTGLYISPFLKILPTQSSLWMAAQPTAASTFTVPGQGREGRPEIVSRTFWKHRRSSKVPRMMQVHGEGGKPIHRLRSRSTLAIGTISHQNSSKEAEERKMSLGLSLNGAQRQWAVQLCGGSRCGWSGTLMAIRALRTLTPTQTPALNELFLPLHSPCIPPVEVALHILLFISYFISCDISYLGGS